MDRSSARVLAVSGRGELITFELSAGTGELRRQHGVATGGHEPSFAALHPAGRVAYVVNERSDTVAVIDLEAMARTSLHASAGAGPAFASVSRGGGRLFVANYGGGTVACFTLDTSGVELHQERVLELGPHPHAAVLDPSERMLIVPALGADAVYAVPLEQGMLGEPLRFGVKAGSGPRHVAFDRGRTLLVCELSSELSLLNGAHGKGGLYELGRVSLLPPGVSSAGNTGADVHVHPGGRFAYVSNRGHDSIAVFAVDGPEPRLLAHTPTRGRVPRNFALSPDGQLLLVANLGSDSIAAFRIDASSGTLEPLALNEGIAEPFWVGFAR